jgi:hypothetical protein
MPAVRCRSRLVRRTTPRRTGDGKQAAPRLQLRETAIPMLQGPGFGSCSSAAAVDPTTSVDRSVAQGVRPHPDRGIFGLTLQGGLAAPGRRRLDLASSAAR